MAEGGGGPRLGRYLIEGELGRGAMGVVYRARDPRIDRVVALKTLRADAAPDPEVAAEVKQRFLNEAKAAGRLNHPNIVTVFDADEDPASGTAYLAMELVEGVELKDLLKDGLDVERLLSILAGIAAALDHAHERGVVHRDVKPANILLDSEGRARLTDFGIARLGSSTMTQDGQFLGSPAYMSPEQVRSQEITGATDIFALGVIAYEALTGVRPFAGADLVSTTHAIAHEEPRRPSELGPGLGPAADEVLCRALAKSPADRPPTATEFVRMLRRALEEPGAPAADSAAEALLGSAMPKPARAAGRRPLVVAGVLAAILVPLLAWALLGGPQDASREQEAASTADGGSSGPTKTPEPAAGEATNDGGGAELGGGPTAASGDDVAARDGNDAALGTEADAAAAPGEASEPTAGARAESGPDARDAAAPASSPAATTPVSTAARGTLRIDLHTFQAGMLTVRDGDEQLAQQLVSQLKRKRGLKLRNPKRHFEVLVSVPSGRRVLTFAFDVEDGRRLRHRAVKDVPPGGELNVVVDVGTLGRDLDVRFP